jgi:hypothetical protein
MIVRFYCASNNVLYIRNGDTIYTNSFYASIYMSFELNVKIRNN